ncbi:NAD-dependent epimerase/dehydratase family protein [Paenibacillus thermotolerans]|uniref:NAD-dependent epimerase/dehydratase family protein n=1 Tax=Paenibacillus thermotolerans TaxID=3027807 RepID=UPI0023688809|nr:MULTISPECIES: NAD-dependent epimerase/dehydratase family protein [unclassified Paenibacillus]
MPHAFRNVLVTGGAGFVGSNLVRRLLPISEHIIVIDDCSTSKPSALPVSNKITFMKQSYVSDELLENVLGDIQHIYHLACRNLEMSVQNTDDDFHVNLYGGYLLLKKAMEKSRHLQRFVYTSTASVYGNASVLPTPESEYDTTTPYAASKLSVEHYCRVFHRMHQLPVTVLRLSNAYGPGQLTSNPYCGVIAKFFEAAAGGLPLTVFGDGSQTRDFTYIEDVIEALLLAGISPAAVGGVFNVGTGVETSVNRLAELVLQIAGRPKTQTQFSPKRKVDVVTRRCLNSDLLQYTLGWKAKTTLEEGLERTYRWLNGG